MSRMAWMMLKRLSQTLVSSTVAIAMTNPTTIPRCTLAHLNAKCSVMRSSSLRPPKSRDAAAMSARPSPRPTNVPAIAESDGVAPAFGGERADERAPPQPDRAQHAELRLPFVGEHEEDVDEQQDAGEYGKHSERRVQPRERFARAIGAIEDAVFDVFDAVLPDGREPDRRPAATALGAPRPIRHRLGSTRRPATAEARPRARHS